MKITLSVVAITALAILSCKKDSGPRYHAEANFSVSAYLLGTNYQDAVIKVGTYDLLQFTNQSTYADSVRWDFGDGQSSNSYNADYAYKNAGIYTVTLTVYNKNGTNDSYSRKIQAMERVIKKLTITLLYLNKFQPVSKHTFTKADLWVEVKYAREGQMDVVNPDLSMNLPVIYKSPVFANVDSGFHGTLTYELPLSPKAVINYPVRTPEYPYYPPNSRGTVVECWAKDSTGSYMMGASWATGLQLLSGGGNPKLSSTFDLGYSITGSLVNQIKFDCLYQ